MSFICWKIHAQVDYFFIVTHCVNDQGPRFDDLLWFNCLKNVFVVAIECFKLIYTIKMFLLIWNTLAYCFISLKPMLEIDALIIFECDSKHFTNSHFTIHIQSILWFFYTHYAHLYERTWRKPPSYSDYSNKNELRWKKNAVIETETNCFYNYHFSLL